MRELSWDDKLATSAQYYADICNFEHSSFVQRGLGENIWTSSFSSYRGAIEFMYSELYDRTCNCSNFFKHCCGHYSQVTRKFWAFLALYSFFRFKLTWDSTTRVGCGFSICKHVLNSPGFRYILVCHYDPPGNYVSWNGNGLEVGATAFEYATDSDPVCSKCRNYGLACHEGLCRWILILNTWKHKMISVESIIGNYTCLEPQDYN